VLVAVSAVVAAACNKPVDTPVAAEAVQDIKASSIIYGMTSYLMAAGVRQGRVDADTAYTYSDSSDISLIGMHVVFYDDNGRERATVTADSGRMNRRTQSMVAKGNVVLVVAADGRKIQSAELNYDPNRDRLWSDSATVQTTADGVVTKGSSFVSDLEFKHVTIQNIRGGGGIVF
jgi:LPS export ABC transporter protein LptC